MMIFFLKFSLKPAIPAVIWIEYIKRENPIEFEVGEKLKVS
jgi:hypothetical protein